MCQYLAASLTSTPADHMSLEAPTRTATPPEQLGHWADAAAELLHVLPQLAPVLQPCPRRQHGGPRCSCAESEVGAPRHQLCQPCSSFLPAPACTALTSAPQAVGRCRHRPQTCSRDGPRLLLHAIKMQQPRNCSCLPHNSSTVICLADQLHMISSQPASTLPKLAKTCLERT